MAKNTRFVGLDVHAETIAVAVSEAASPRYPDPFAVDRESFYVDEADRKKVS